MSHAPNLLPPIQKGEHRGGRAKGQTNKFTRVLKKALVLAAEKSIHSKDKSLESYCTYLADEKQELFVHMLARLIPEQAKIKPEMNLHVQRLDINMSLSDMVSVFEQKINSDYRPPMLTLVPNVIEHDDDSSSDESDA
jgi:hypothetical protein